MSPTGNAYASPSSVVPYGAPPVPIVQPVIVSPTVARTENGAMRDIILLNNLNNRSHRLVYHTHHYHSRSRSPQRVPRPESHVIYDD
jgi:uncharacterized protein YjlB